MVNVIIYTEEFYEPVFFSKVIQIFGLSACIRESEDWTKLKLNARAVACGRLGETHQPAAEVGESRAAKITQ